MDDTRCPNCRLNYAHQGDCQPWEGTDLQSQIRRMEELQGIIAHADAPGASPGSQETEAPRPRE